MSRERKLFGCGKNTHSHTALALGGRVAGQNERGFRKIGLPGNGLHLVIAQPAPVGEHRQLVAFERDRGKNVKLPERQPVFRV